MLNRGGQLGAQSFKLSKPCMGLWIRLSGLVLHSHDKHGAPKRGSAKTAILGEALAEF